jgi:NitT/TauT family transport system substrate-binding protein
LKFLFVIFTALLSLSAVIGLTACERPQPIRVATHVWPGYEFLWLGQQLDYLPESDIRLIDSHSATASIGLLQTGQADAATLTLDEVLKARSMGLDLTVILIMDVSVGADKLIARDKVKKIEDLRGGTIAVEDTAVGRLLLNQAIATAALDSNEFHIHPVTIERHVEAWQSDQPDAIVTYEPAATEILQLGGHVLFDSSQVPETIVDVLAVRTDLIQERDSMLQTLVSGFFRAQKHFFTNPQDAAYRISSRLNVPSREVMYLYRGLEIAAKERNMRLLDKNNTRLQEVARKILALNLFAVPPETDPSTNLYTDEFVQ